MVLPFTFNRGLPLARAANAWPRDDRILPLLKYPPNYLKHPYYTFCSAVRCASLAAHVAPHRSGSRGVCHIEPSEPATPDRPGARRPWRPSHPRRPVCQRNARRRNLGFLWCSDPAGCKHRRLGHISRIRAWGSRGLFGKLGCPL